MQFPFHLHISCSFMFSLPIRTILLHELGIPTLPLHQHPLVKEQYKYSTVVTIQNHTTKPMLLLIFGVIYASLC